MLERVRAVSLDFFGTLIDFVPCLEPACADVLGAVEGGGGGGEGGVAADGGAVGAPALARSWGRHFGRMLEEAAHLEDGDFRTVRRVTEDALAAALAEHGLEADPARGTEAWFERVRAAELFSDVRGALARLAARYRLAVTSDTDDDVIAPPLAREGLPVEVVVTSESLRAYKIGPSLRLWRDLCARLALAPDEVLHVGDSPWDVAGAKRAGCVAVHLDRGDRNVRALPDGCEPDLTVRDLAELAERLLGGG